MDVKVRQVGETLRKFRTHAGYTLEDVASALAVSRGYLSRVEGGSSRLSAVQLERLCTYLKIPRAETQTLFQALGKLPPSLVERLLKTPKDWEHLS